MKQQRQGTWMAKRVWTETPAAEIASSHQLPSAQKVSSRILLGRLEWVKLSNLRIAPWLAKTDTGARTSALHATHIRLHQDRKSVTFQTHGDDGSTISCSARLSRIQLIRSSSGMATERYIVHLDAELPGGLRFPIELSLADRSHMKCPMLLGRRALAGYFLIDPQSEFLLGRFAESPL